jgi:3-keto-disaccharide hydrolase
MRIPVIRMAIATALLWGCSSPEKSHPSPAPGTGGAAGTGQAGSGGSGGAPGGTGGSTAGSGGSAPSGGSGGTPATTPDAAPAPAPADDAGPPAEPVAPGAFPGCPKCKPIFDGTTLNGWIQDPAGSFEVKAGAIASTGKGAHAWTKDDYGEFRIIFSVRQVKGNHKPCTTLFNTRPANGKAARGLSGIQFQPPLGGSWDYRPGKNVGPNGTAWTYPNPRPMFDVAKWNRCEILARASTGEFRGACCEIEGKTTCKAQEVLHFKDASAGKKGPFALMMHNGGLFDEYKDLWVETDPVGDELVTTK